MDLLTLDLRHVRREFEMHRLAHDHPNVADVYNLVVDPITASLFVEYAGSRTVYDHILEEQWTDKHRRTVLLQISSALVHVHSKGVVHMDLKPENVMVDDGPHLHVRLIDFGLSRSVSDLTVPRCGTLGYTAPEVLARSLIRDPTQIDVWSFGILVIALFHVHLPFRVAHVRQCPPYTAFVHAQWCDRSPTAALDVAYETPPFVWRGLDAVLVDATLHIDPTVRRSMAAVHHMIASFGSGSGKLT